MELWIDVVDTSEQAIDEGARLVVLQDQDKPRELKFLCTFVAVFTDKK